MTLAAPYAFGLFSLADKPDQTQKETLTLTPTTAQIESILKPWRKIKQRQLATEPGLVGAVWLRTCYAEVTDSKHADLIEGLDMENAVDDSDRLLDDKSLYDFGPNWERILYCIPELVSNYDDDDGRAQRIQKEIDDFREAQAALLIPSPPGAELEPPSSITWLVSSMRSFFTTPAEVELEVLSAIQSSIHKACVVNYIILEDKEALLPEATSEGLVRLIFLDSCGYVVRSNRISAGDAEQMGGQWLEHCFDERDREWKEAEFGDEYKEGGRKADLTLYSNRPLI